MHVYHLAKAYKLRGQICHSWQWGGVSSRDITEASFNLPATEERQKAKDYKNTERKRERARAFERERGRERERERDWLTDWLICWTLILRQETYSYDLSLLKHSNSNKSYNMEYWKEEGKIKKDLQRIDTSNTNKSSVDDNTRAEHKTVSEYKQLYINSIQQIHIYIYNKRKALA